MNKINLELKHHCSDFKNVRKVLKEFGAKKEVIKKQKDYFFNLPKDTTKESPRLKLRIEGDAKTLVYYERPDFTKSRNAVADVKLYKVKDNEFLPFLEAILGVRGVVEKKREVWRKAHVIFNLDTVKGVGGVFEIELQKTGRIAESDITLFTSYQQKLLPFLDKVIGGSNIDLVTKKKKAK